VRRFAAFAWTNHRDKILYLVVGGWNTVFQWVCFSVLYYLLQDYLFSSWILVITHVITSINGFLGYRYIVFASRGHPFAEYLKYQLVWLPLFLTNLVVLPLALEYTPLNAYVVQALFGAFGVVAGFIGNKYFAFRKVKSATPASPPEEPSDSG